MDNRSRFYDRAGLVWANLYNAFVLGAFLWGLFTVSGLAALVGAAVIAVVVVVRARSRWRGRWSRILDRVFLVVWATAVLVSMALWYLAPDAAPAVTGTTVVAFSLYYGGPALASLLRGLRSIARPPRRSWTNGG